MTDHAKKAHALIGDQTIAALSEPGHPFIDTRCPHAGIDHECDGHDYGHLLAALTHAVLAVADALTKDNTDDQ